MKTVYWRVRFLRAPSVLRYCKHCGVKTEFVSSGFFRVNAQQKSLDVWLIYKCAECDTTWNLTLLSRVSPTAIPYETLQGFYSNDKALAMQYAMDVPLIKRCGGEPCMPTYEVHGENVSLKEAIEIHLSSEWTSDLKVSAVLREKLGISRSRFDNMCANGDITCISGHNLKKSKLNEDVIIRITGKS